MKQLIFLLFAILSISAYAQITDIELKQKVLNKFQFEEYSIPTEKDTILFYLHKTKNVQPTKLVLYLQGTTPTPDPFFEIRKIKEGYSYIQYFPSDYELLGDEYAFAFIAVPGVSAIKNIGQYNLTKYNSLNSLDYRGFQADTVINYISEQLFELDKTIVYGHSEGAPVAARLGTVNTRISHLGFWAGNALPDFYDFILFERKANLQGLQSDSTTQKNIEDVISLFETIAADSLNTVPANTNEITEYTNKRWWSYAEPPINDLVKIDIPLYVQVATEDESVAVESTYLIPLEFIRLKKDNLTFKACVGCDHSFVKGDKDLWSDIFLDFISWTEKE